MQIFQHIITAMFFFQIIMVALFGIKKAPGPAVLTAVLLPITLAFLLYNLKLFNRPQVIVSNRTAADIDRRHAQVSYLALPGYMCTGLHTCHCCWKVTIIAPCCTC